MLAKNERAIVVTDDTTFDQNAVEINNAGLQSALSIVQSGPAQAVKDEVSSVTLYGGVEDEDPYKYMQWEEVDGRGLGVEDLFEAQVWTNYSMDSAHIAR